MTISTEQECTSVYSISGGIIAVYTLTNVSDPPDTLVDGARFRFIPNTAAYLGAIKIDHSDTSAGLKWLRGVDALSYSTYGDIQAGKPITIQWMDDDDCFIICDTLPYSQMIFPHGRCKLQTSGPAQISVTQEDGSSLMVWSEALGCFRPTLLPVITNSSLFTAANTVEGVANQALAANQLYSVYAHNTNDNGQTIELDFWRTYTGTGVIGYPPIVNELKFYVKSNLGGTGIDNTRTYLGILWTGDSDVETSLAGPHIKIPCQSHHNVWHFPFNTPMRFVDPATNITFADMTDLSVDFVTEGITDTGLFQVISSAYSNTGGFGYVLEVRLKITGTTFDGLPFTAYSIEGKQTPTAKHAFCNVMSSWGAAIPMGHYTVTPQYRVNSGSGHFENYLTGYLAN